MRISDWSSDVCSSDLCCRASPDTGTACTRSPHPGVRLHARRLGTAPPVPDSPSPQTGGAPGFTIQALGCSRPAPVPDHRLSTVAGLLPVTTGFGHYRQPLHRGPARTTLAHNNSFKPNALRYTNNMAGKIGRAHV